MCDANETVPCCRRYSRPEQQCARHPACDGCQHLAADESPTVEDVNQRAEGASGLTGFEDRPTSEPIRDLLY